MRVAVPYWFQRLSSSRFNEEKIESLDDLAALPRLTKAEFRALQPMELVPQEVRPDVAVGRWTSGTTGRPTASFWTQSDWAGLISNTARIACLVGSHPPRSPSRPLGSRASPLSHPEPPSSPAVRLAAMCPRAGIPHPTRSGTLQFPARFEDRSPSVPVSRILKPNYLSLIGAVPWKNQIGRTVQVSVRSR
jgi:hypothetical protein